MGLHVLAPVDAGDQEKTRLDIVAIHGLNGDAYGSWTFVAKDRSKCFWLQDLLPERLPFARIMTFGYNAKLLGLSTSTIDDDARDLLARIKAKRISMASGSPLLFIAYSLGGIVVKQAMILAKNDLEYTCVLKATKGIVFIGTPHRGSVFASVASPFAGMLSAAGLNPEKPRLKALKRHSHDLDRITEYFRHLTPNFRIVSCYETQVLPGFGQLVVERDSAIMGIAGEILIPLNASHRDMCRVSSCNDENVFGILYPILEQLAHALLAEAERQDLNDFNVNENFDPAPERHLFIPVPQNALFTGRKQILEQIYETFKSKTHAQTRVILTGLGGVGKTQIATTFAYTSYAAKEFSTILWTSANSRERLIQSFTDIALHLGLYHSLSNSSSYDNIKQDKNALHKLEMSRHVDVVRNWLSAHEKGDWLLIFDNVDDLDSFDLSEFFPRTTNGHIMITSRCQQASRFGKMIKVDMMDDADAMSLLVRSSLLTSSIHTEAAKELLEVLGNLPLAIDQAGAYIAEQGIDFEAYLKLYRLTQARILEHKPPKAVWSYEQTVFTTWEMSYNIIASHHQLAAKLLDIAAYFAFDDIPLETVMNLARDPMTDVEVFLSSFIPSITARGDFSGITGPIEDQLTANEVEIAMAIGKLLSYSLVQRKSETKSLSMHPLVHTWLKERHQSSSDAVQAARLAIGLVHRAMFNATDLSKFADVQMLYSHAFTCNSHFEYMPELFDVVDGPKLAACIIAVDAWVPLSMDQGTLQKSDRFYDIISKRESKNAFQIPQALLTLRNAYRLSSLGLRRESSNLCEEYFRAPVVRDSYAAMYRACMAQMYAPSLFRRGLYDRAESVYASSPTDCDPTDYMLARKELVLGAIMIDRGRFTEANNYFVACREILERRVGPEFFIWSVSHQLTGLCYIAQERFGDAEKAVGPILFKKIKLLKEGKLVLAFSDYELAEVYARAVQKQGRHAEAIKLLDDILAATQSRVAPPARALGELSHLRARIDQLVGELTASTSLAVDTTLHELLQDASLTYDRAALAYEIEWTRGTWVFKFFDDYLREVQEKLQPSFSQLISSRPTFNTKSSSGTQTAVGTMSLWESQHARSLEGGIDGNSNASRQQTARLPLPGELSLNSTVVGEIENEPRQHRFDRFQKSLVKVFNARKHP